MVGHDDFRYRVGKAKQPGLRPPDLLLTDPSAFEGERTRGVDPEDGDFAVAIKRLQIILDVALVFFQPAKAGQKVIKRHVVIPRNDNFRRGERVQEGARRAELLFLRALGEIAGDGDQVGPDLCHGFDQRLHGGVADTAEVKIGEVNQRAHGRIHPPSFLIAGTMIFSAPLRIR